MALVIDILRDLIPYKRKTTPSGWTSFDAPCCHHRGHNRDTKMRAGIMLNNEFVYHCFNCGFATGWSPGNSISPKLRDLCKWLGASDDDVKRLIFEALKTEGDNYVAKEREISVDFPPKDLPESSMPISKWLETYDDMTSEFLNPVIEYLINRGCNPLSNHFYWSPAEGYSDRVIIPFKYQGRIVGSTGRKITKGKPKYLSDQHPNFVFNVDEQLDDSKYVFVVEGPFDALAIGGVALLSNNISEQQAKIINRLHKHVIVIPDQDKAGLDVIDKARDLGWSVAFPTWDSDVKDCSDAVNRYGKLFVIMDLIKTATEGSIKINLAKGHMKRRLQNAQTN